MADADGCCDNCCSSSDNSLHPVHSHDHWDDLRHRGGFETSKHHHAKPPLPHAGDKERDHLYSLIDRPHRAKPEPPQLFGQAKPFPEVTRTGYRDYLHHLLSEKSKTHKHKDHHHHPDAECGEECAADDSHHHHHSKAFGVKDFGLIYRFRIRCHAELAEFLGMFVFLSIGFAATCQEFVGGDKSNYTIVVLSWGIGQMCGIYIAGGYSGAHLNPVLTLNLWFYRGFPFRRMFSFWLAQFLGAFAATAWIFILYYPALRKLDPDGWTVQTGTAFYTAPADGIPTASAWFNEVTCTAIIHIIIFAVGDSHNINPARGMNALILGFAVTALGSTFGYLSPFGMNPARDFSPRIFLSMVGFPKQLWTFHDWWWATGGITGPLLGGYLGSFAYDIFIFDGPESPVNFPSSIKMRVVRSWMRGVVHPLQRKSDKRIQERRQGGYNENPYRGTVHLQGQPAQ